MRLIIFLISHLTKTAQLQRTPPKEDKHGSRVRASTGVRRSPPWRLTELQFCELGSLCGKGSSIPWTFLADHWFLSSDPLPLDWLQAIIESRFEAYLYITYDYLQLFGLIDTL
jgi:hypothetical protein